MLEQTVMRAFILYLAVFLISSCDQSLDKSPSSIPSQNRPIIASKDGELEPPIKSKSKAKTKSKRR